MPNTTPVRVVCAWCGAEVRQGPAEPVSHGLCAQCEGRVLDEALASSSRAAAAKLG